MVRMAEWRIFILLVGFCVGFGANAVSAEDTLFADMGGHDTIVKIANHSVDNFLADIRIKAIFDESNDDRIRQKLAEEYCHVAGGPCVYTGHGMYETHRGLHLTNADFNAVVEDVQNAMDKEGIPFATQNRFLARLAPMQRLVVTR
jgi:hemoglobin